MDRRTFLTLMGLGWLSSASPEMIASFAQLNLNTSFHTTLKNLKSTEFYLSPNGNDSWSGKIPNPNRLNTDGPFATLKRVRDEIRNIKRQQGGTLNVAITVLLRGGTYFLKEPLVFTSEDSGTAEFPIIYKNYRNEKPVISGGHKITGWQKEGEIWKVNLPEVQNGNWYFHILKVQNHWAIRARYPNFEPNNPYSGGWLINKNTEQNKKEVMVDSNQFPSWSDWSESQINFFPGEGFWNAIIAIDSVNKQNNKILIRSQQDIKPGNRFFLTNSIDALDSPGEWYLSKQTGELFYWPSESDFEKLTVIAPKLSSLIEFKGNLEQGNFVEYLHLQGLSFQDTDYTIRSGYGWALDAAIILSAARQCHIKQCYFNLLGGYAVRLDTQSNSNHIVSNQMKDLGQGAVLLYSHDEKNQPFLNSILANDIEGCGLIFKHVGGVFVITGSDNKIAFNSIKRLSRFGIAFGPQTHNNLVEYNEIFDSNLETADTGAIYINGQSKQLTNNIIRFNYISKSGGLGTNQEGNILFPYYSWGIYLDNYTSGTIVYGNIVIDTVLGGFFIHAGQNNRIENNIFLNGLESQGVFLQLDENFMTGNIIKNNIIVFNQPQAKLYSKLTAHPRRWNPKKNLQECDYNLYWHTGEINLASEPNITPEGSLTQWKSLGFDQNSLVSDPLFRDFKNGDFRLQSNSPAFELGFQSIPVHLIGLKGFNS